MFWPVDIYCGVLEEMAARLRELGVAHVARMLVQASYAGPPPLPRCCLAGVSEACWGAVRSRRIMATWASQSRNRSRAAGCRNTKRMTLRCVAGRVSIRPQA